MVVIVQLMVVLDASIVTIALPSIQRALHISAANRQWAITAYTLAFGGLLLLGGRIADFGGRRRMFILGLVGFAGASALGGSAVDQAMLFGSRALQGAFAALMAPAALSILTITFQNDPGERAKAFGAYGAVAGAGAAVGALAGGVLTEYASWRWCLLINVPIALLAAVAALRVIRESRASGKTRYDIPGALLSTAGLVSLVYGFTKAVTDGWSSAPTLTLLAVGVILLAAFVVVEARSASSAAPAAGRPGTESGRLVPGHPAQYGGSVRHVHLRQLLHAADPSLLASQSRRRLPSLRTRRDRRRRGGNKLGAQDRPSRRHDRRPFLPTALGLLWLTQIGVHTSYWTHLFPQQIVMSLGLGLAFPALSSTALTKVQEQDSGVASAMVNTTQQVGASLGAALLNTVAATATANYLASHGPRLAPNAVVHGFTVAFAVGAALWPPAPSPAGCWSTRRRRIYLAPALIVP